MNLKLIIGIVLLLIVSLFVNIALSFNIVSEGDQAKKYKKHNQELQSIIDELKAEKKEVEGLVTGDMLLNDDSKNVVEKFFRTQYEYDTSNYKNRFELIKPYVSNNVYGQLTAAGIPDIPDMKFENKIKDIQLYLGSNNNIISGLVLLDTVYTIEGLKNPVTTQIFQVKLGNENGVQQITELKVLGSFAAMSES